MAVPLQSPLLLGPTSSPAADSTGLILFNDPLAGRHMLKQMGPSGLDTYMQPHQGRNRMIQYTPNINGGLGMNIEGAATAMTGVGTNTSATKTLTNLFVFMFRSEWLVTVAATTAVVGLRHATAHLARGNVAKVGGFHFIQRWGPATGVSNTSMRAFAGLQASVAAPTDVQPSSLLNMIGMGWDAADAQVQMMTNDGTGTATKVALGASFPVPTVDRTSVYEIALFCPPNGSDVKWQVTDLVSDAEASGTITTDLPAATTMLTPNSYMSVGGASAVVGFAHMGTYVESDY